jgi:hypothetical protein
MAEIYNGLVLPLLNGTQTVPVPPPNTIVIFARDDQSVWMKRSDGTEERISEQ